MSVPALATALGLAPHPEGAGASLQLEAPAATGQTARLLGTEPALVTCVVSPGFDFADFEPAAG